MKFSTPVDPYADGFSVTLDDRIMVLGSCFADEMGSKLSSAGFNVCINPFGTLYNPASILNSIRRLESGEPFAEKDCVQMGAGAGLVCSFSHHTSFAGKNSSEFLETANASLAKASAFWKGCNKVIVTLGTAKVWRLRNSGTIVSNCLKRPAAEFTHEMLSAGECSELLSQMTGLGSGRDFLFTVSPIRHLSGGAHENTLSKARLQLAVEAIGAPYFPAAEILLDELRDYRFYSDDLVHPSPMAVEYIWEKFTAAVVPASLHGTMKEKEKATRREAHRPLHR